MIHKLSVGTVKVLARIVTGDDKPYYRTMNEIADLFQHAGVPIKNFTEGSRGPFARNVLHACNSAESVTGSSRGCERSMLIEIIKSLADIRTYRGLQDPVARTNIHSEVCNELHELLGDEDLRILMDDRGRVIDIRRLNGPKDGAADSVSASRTFAGGGNGSDTSSSQRVFIVHGHDDGLLNELKVVLHELGIEAVVLRDYPSSGKTVIEKFQELASSTNYAIVLLSPDDVGKKQGHEPLRTRARQNVILELGYFYGALGRSNVTAVNKSVEDVPSDIYGVLEIRWDNGGSWRHKLAGEMRAAGLPVDSNKLSFS